VVPKFARDDEAPQLCSYFRQLQELHELENAPTHLFNWRQNFWDFKFDPRISESRKTLKDSVTTLRKHAEGCKPSAVIS